MPQFKSKTGTLVLHIDGVGGTVTVYADAADYDNPVVVAALRSHPDIQEVKKSKPSQPIIQSKDKARR